MVVVKVRLGTVEAALADDGREEAAASVRGVSMRKVRRDVSSFGCRCIG